MEIELKDIKKDQTFWEVDLGEAIRMVALEDTHPVTITSTEGIGCKVMAFYQDGVGCEIELFESNNCPSCYRLDLYSEDPRTAWDEIRASLRGEKKI